MNTYALDTASRYRQLVAIQRGHLQSWAPLLKPEVHAMLCKLVTQNNPTLGQFINSISEPEIVRGQAIYEMLVNVVPGKLEKE